MYTMIRYEDENYYFVWKPHGIPTTFGMQECFLEHIVHEKPPFFAALQHHFTKEQEYGLVNRLDNDTAGLLYFAKRPDVKQQYKVLQSDQKLYKIYMCTVSGEMSLSYPVHGEWVVHASTPAWVFGEPLKGILVQYPIMHHKQDAERMIAIKTDKDWQKWRGRENHVQTLFVPLEYDRKRNETLCYAMIQQGMRHQIRVHAAAIGYPIVEDILYGKSGGWDTRREDMELWSIGLRAL